MYFTGDFCQLNSPYGAGVDSGLRAPVAQPALPGERLAAPGTARIHRRRLQVQVANDNMAAQIYHFRSNRPQFESCKQILKQERRRSMKQQEVW